ADELEWRVRAEADSADARAKIADIAASLPGVVYQIACREDGTVYYRFVSDGIKSMFGITPEEVLSDFTRMAAFMDHADYRRIVEGGREAWKALRPWRYEFRALVAGEEKWVRGQSIPRRERDGTLISNGIMLDITAQKRLESALLEREQQFRLIVEGANEG